MGGRAGFSLPELLVVISLIFLLAAAFPAFYGSKTQLLLGFESSLVASEIRKTQSMAVATGQATSWDSAACNLPGGLSFSANRVFSFSSSGFTPPGGSGTLILKAGNSIRKIIVSSYGRVRVE